jgi:hypothetical protein
MRMAADLVHPNGFIADAWFVIFSITREAHLR